VPPFFAELDLAGRRFAAVDDLLDRRRQVDALEGGGEVVHGAPDVTLDQVDELADRGGRLADAQVAVDEQRADPRAAQEIVVVVGDAREVLDLGLVLGVDRVQQIPQAAPVASLSHTSRE
jgi:hypothetical protein